MRKFRAAAVSAAMVLSVFAGDLIFFHVYGSFPRLLIPAAQSEQVLISHKSHVFDGKLKYHCNISSCVDSSVVLSLCDRISYCFFVSFFVSSEYRYVHATVPLFVRCVLLDSGDVKCFGKNFSGQLGLDDTEHRGDDVGEMGEDLDPVNLGGKQALAIAAGEEHT